MERRNRLQSIVESPVFQWSVMGLILVNAVVLGFETSAALVASHGGLFSAANSIIVSLFVVELALRLASYWPRPGKFFLSGWNVFDFIVVALSLLPAVGPFATMARLARILRVVRLVSVSPELRLIVETTLRSIPSIGNVFMLLALLVYVYGVIGVHYFAETAPDHFGHLGLACLSLFQVLTGEAWPDIQQATLSTHPWSWAYFMTFILFAVFIGVNLFIAVIINKLEEVRGEVKAERQDAAPLARLSEELSRLREEIVRLEQLAVAHEAYAGERTAVLGIDRDGR